MKAIVHSKSGPPSVLEVRTDHPLPKRGRNELLVKVVAIAGKHCLHELLIVASLQTMCKEICAELMSAPPGSPADANTFRSLARLSTP